MLMPYLALYAMIAMFTFDPAAVSLPDPGAAFLTPGESQAARDRYESGGDYAGRGTKLIEEADALAAEELAIPRKGGQWSHWYSCPEDGGSLRTESPTEHVCTVCGECYSGWPYDEVYITKRHHHWLRGLPALGWAYTLEPKPAYAVRVREILLTYADFYRDLPIHNKDGKKSVHGARLYAQTLDEAVTLCHMMTGYDRVYNAECFSAEDHAAIAERLVRPMVETIQRHKASRSNWQTWHNAGIACAGFVLRDEAYVDWATNAPKHGLLYQLTEGSVLDSGMWYEGAPSYHWYALAAIVYHLETAARAGMDLYGMPKVQKLFDGPMRLLFPDLTFPAINDSNRSSIKSARRFYEIAWRRYEALRYTVFLEPRDSDWALFWGGKPLPGDAPDSLPLETSNDTSDGLAILRSDDAETAVYLDYGAAESGHVHPAKLGMILYAHGDERFVDPGRLPYGNPLHRGWYTQTIAHNAVVVNGKSQRRCAGALVEFEKGDGFAIVRAKTDEAYAGVTLDRTLILAQDLVFDVVHGASEEEATFDLPLHMRGTLAPLAAKPGAAPLGDSHGYEHLDELARLDDAPGMTATLDTGDASAMAVTFHNSAERYRAKAYGSDPQEMLPCIIQRQHGTNVWFAQVYDMAPGEGDDYEFTAATGTPAFRITGGPRFEIPPNGSVRVD
ncbi:MAG: heparinase II/III family protein [Candidatus Hydrogenedentota bacterium]